MKFILSLCLLLSCSALAQAQVTQLAPSGRPRPVPTKPPGACRARDFIQAQDTGVNSICNYMTLAWVDLGSGGSGAWGDITGVLSDQTDLQSALDDKAPIDNPTFTGIVTAPAFVGSGSTAGYVQLGQGAAPSLGTTAVQIVAPTSVTSYQFKLPAASVTGLLLGTNSSNVNTLSFLGAGCNNGDLPTFNGTTWACVAPAAGGPTINATDNVIPQRSSASAFTNSPITGSVPGSMVDGITVTGAATANPATVTMATTGSDSNIHFKFQRKGTSNFWFDLPDANAKMVIGGANATGSGASTCWFDNPGGAIPRLTCDRTGAQVQLAGDALWIGGGGPIYWDNTGAITGAPQASLARVNVSGSHTLIVGDAAGGGVNGNGWIAHVGNSCFLAADQTNATATLANLNNCSLPLEAGRKYTFKFIAYLNDSVAAEGAKLDFDGGSATMTTFRTHCTVFDTALNLSAQTSALATDFASATVTGDAIAECHGTIVVNAAGTFIPRLAQNSHAAGTLTIYKGSHISMQPVP